MHLWGWPSWLAAPAHNALSGSWDVAAVGHGSLSRPIAGYIHLDPDIANYYYQPEVYRWIQHMQLIET